MRSVSADRDSNRAKAYAFHIGVQQIVPRRVIHQLNRVELRRLHDRLNRDHGLTVDLSFDKGPSRCYGRHSIVIAAHQQSAIVLLHEWAHIWHYTHGPAFMNRWLDLMARYCRLDRGLLELYAIQWGVKI